MPLKTACYHFNIQKKKKTITEHTGMQGALDLGAESVGEAGRLLPCQLDAWPTQTHLLSVSHLDQHLQET